MNNLSIILDNTKMVTGLDVRSLADIFLMDKESLRMIRKGDLSPCTEDTLPRFLEVNDIMMHLSSIFIQSPGHLCKTAILDGDNLYSLLCEQNINREKVMNIARYIMLNYQVKSDLKQMNQTTIDQLTKHS